MALINRPTQVHQQLPKFFNTLREGTAPDKFTQQYLVDIGFGSSNYRVLIPLLKDLGFLTADGSPTERYKSYLDSSRSRTVLGEAVKEAYSDLFTITKNPTKSDREKISGKFKSTFNLSDLGTHRTFRFECDVNIASATSFKRYPASDKYQGSRKFKWAGNRIEVRYRYPLARDERYRGLQRDI
jgi:hypothetical protein